MFVPIESNSPLTEDSAAARIISRMAIATEAETAQFQQDACGNDSLLTRNRLGGIQRERFGGFRVRRAAPVF